MLRTGVSQTQYLYFIQSRQSHSTHSSTAFQQTGTFANYLATQCSSKSCTTERHPTNTTTTKKAKSSMSLSSLQRHLPHLLQPYATLWTGTTIQRTSLKSTNLGRVFG